MMVSVIEAKNALDTVIKKQRVHLYKPIQIAEILYHSRVAPNSFNISNLEDYRNKSKKWRDIISLELVGRKSTSSAKYQDDLFNKSAIPPEVIEVLDSENKRTQGAVEAYIYNRFVRKHNQLSIALSYATQSTKDDFSVEIFINSFRQEAGLKRSIDKIFEIVVFALLETIISALEFVVEVSINEDKIELLTEFNDFADKIMQINFESLSHSQSAKVFRVGVTNASDRGLDMYSNWGPAIQIKHLSLDAELAENIVSSVSSDRIIIVCKDAEESIILSLLNQIGWKSRIQSIVTESNLFSWYEKALKGKYADILADNLLTTLADEITNEFPSIDETPNFYIERNYSIISDDFWTI